MSLVYKDDELSSKATKDNVHLKLVLLFRFYLSFMGQATNNLFIASLNCHFIPPLKCSMSKVLSLIIGHNTSQTRN